MQVRSRVIRRRAWIQNKTCALLRPVNLWKLWRKLQSHSTIGLSPGSGRIGRVLRGLQDAGQVRGIAGGISRRGGGGFWHLVEVVVVSFAHRLVVPIRATLGGDAEADIVQSLKTFGDDVVSTVFVADHRNEVTLSLLLLIPDRRA